MPLPIRNCDDIFLNGGDAWCGGDATHVQSWCYQKSQPPCDDEDDDGEVVGSEDERKVEGYPTDLGHSLQEVVDVLHQHSQGNSHREDMGDVHCIDCGSGGVYFLVC